MVPRLVTLIDLQTRRAGLSASADLLVYNLSGIGVTERHAQQFVRFTACSACRRPATGGATERSAN